VLELNGGADPVILDRLIRIENNGVALTDEDVETVDDFGDVVDTVDLKGNQSTDQYWSWKPGRRTSMTVRE
jgi:hypothetical protein